MERRISIEPCFLYHDLVGMIKKDGRLDNKRVAGAIGSVKGVDMLKNPFAEEWKKAFGPVGQIVLALIVGCIVVFGIAEAQSSDTSGTVLRFKIPPAQPSAPPSTVPTPAQSPSTASTPALIEEKPAASIQQPETAPTELSHEVLTPQTPEKGTTASATPTTTQPAGSAPQPKTAGKTPVIEKAQPVVKQDAKGTGGEKSAKMLLSLDVQKNDPSGEILNVTLNGFHPPQVSAAEGAPPRIICDFPEVGLEKKVPKVLPVNGKYITQVRVGLHTQPVPKVRIVLDLVPEHNYDVEQFFYQKENLYTLVVKKRP